MKDIRFLKIIRAMIWIIALIVMLVSLYFLNNFNSQEKPIAGEGQNFTNDDAFADIGRREFELIDHNGKIFTNKDLLGQINLIYFGFTYCPDICPISLTKLAEVMTILDKYKINVKSIFVTIDPARDNADLLKDYLKHFNGNIIGLTGSDKQVKDMADNFKVFYVKSKMGQEKPDYDKNYMIDHSSFIYLLDKNGKYVKHFYLSTPKEEILEYIRINHKNL